MLAAERTAAAARGAFEFTEPRTIAAKGKGDGVVCRALVRALSLRRPRGVGGLRAAFVGRERELELLRATYRRALTEREPHLVTIIGDAGVGKSRLVGELWEWLGAEPSAPLRRTGRCLPYGRGITYWPLGEILKEQLGILDSDPPAQVRRRLGSYEILGLALGLDVAGDLHPLAARERLHDAWLAFLEEVVAVQPAVLLVEDLHWAESDLLDLLGRLGDVRGPLLVLGTARPDLPERRPAWSGQRRDATSIRLEPLEPVESGQLLARLLGSALPDGLRELIVGRVDGNPFFAEELLAALIDQGVLKRADGVWTADEPPEGFDVPDSVQAVLAARIDLLPAREKAALQAASVIGRVFWRGPLRELLGGVAPDLELLEERDFVRRRSGSSITGEQEFAIKHALTREVAYTSLPKAKRARLHAAFAGWIERLGEGRDELAAQLAYHYAEAVRPEHADLAWADEPEELERLRMTALGWLRRAAALAVGRYEIEETLALLERALALEPAEGERAELWRRIGEANALRFDGEAFLAAMLRSLELSRDRSTRAEIYAELAFHTAVRSGMWKARPDPQLVEGWIDQALELAEPESKARATALAARAFWRPRTAAAEARDASALADRLGDLELRSYAWAARAAAAYEQRRFSEAEAWSQRRLEMLPEISDPDHIVEVYEFAVPTTAAVGRLDEARRLAAKHVEASRTLSPHHRVHGLALTVDVEEMAGDWERIRALTAGAEAAVEANLATPCIRNVRLLLLCALASAVAGDEARAQALELASDACGMEDHGFSLAAPRIRLALQRDDLQDVARLLEGEAHVRHLAGPGSMAARLDGLAALRDRQRLEDEAPPLLQAGTYIEPFALRVLGQVRENHELIGQALARFEAMGLDWHAQQTRVLLDAQLL